MPHQNTNIMTMLSVIINSNSGDLFMYFY